MIRNLIIFLSCIFVLTGCFSPIKSEPATLYVLNAAPQPSIKTSLNKSSLYVASVEADPIYNSTSMAYSVRPYEINYFVKNRWAASPAKMLHPLIVQTMQKTRFFSIVSGSPFGRYNFILNVQLIKLQQQFTGNTSFVDLVLLAKLINASTNQVIATRQFSITETAPSNTPYGGVIAANKAVSRMLTALASFCTTSTYAKSRN